MTDESHLVGPRKGGINPPESQIKERPPIPEAMKGGAMSDLNTDAEEELSPEEMAQAEQLARQLDAKAEQALSSLDREMNLMRWPAEYRSLLWSIVARKALRKAKR